MKIKAGEASITFWPQEFNSWNHSISQNIARLGAGRSDGTNIPDNIFPGQSFRIFPYDTIPGNLQLDWQTHALGKSTIGLSFDSCYCDFEICFGDPSGAAVAVELKLGGQLLSRVYQATPTPQAGDPVVPAAVADSGGIWLTSTSREFRFNVDGREWAWTETGEDWYDVRVVQIDANGARTTIGDAARIPVVSLQTPFYGESDSSMPGCQMSATVGVAKTESGWSVNAIAAHSGYVAHLPRETTASLPASSYWFFRVLAPAAGSPTAVTHQGTTYALTRVAGGSAVLINFFGQPVMGFHATSFLGIGDDGTRRLLNGAVNLPSDSSCAYSGWPLSRARITNHTNGLAVHAGLVSASGGASTRRGPGFLDGPFSVARGFANHLNFSTQFTTQYETVDRWTGKAVAYPLPKPASMPPNNTVGTSNKGQTRFLSAVNGTPLDATLATAPDTVYQIRIDATRRQAASDSSWFHPVGEIEYAILGYQVQFVDGEFWTYDNVMGPYGISGFWGDNSSQQFTKSREAGFSHILAANYEHCPSLIINGVPEKTPVVRWTSSAAGVTDVALEQTRNGVRLPMNWLCSTAGGVARFFRCEASIETDPRVGPAVVNGNLIPQRDYYIPDQNGEIDISGSNYTVSIVNSSFGASASGMTVASSRAITGTARTFSLDYS